MCRAGSATTFNKNTEVQARMSLPQSSSDEAVSPHVVATSPKKRLFALSNCDSSTIQCYNLPSCELAFTIKVQDNDAGSGILSGIHDDSLIIRKMTFVDDAHLACCVAGSAGTLSIHIYDTRTSNLVHKINTPENSVLHDICPSNTGSSVSVLALTYTPRLEKWHVLEYDATNGALLRKIKAGSSNSAAELKGVIETCCEKVAVAMGMEVRIIENRTGKRISKILLPERHGNATKMSFVGLNGKQILVCTDTNCMLLFPATKVNNSDTKNDSHSSFLLPNNTSSSAESNRIVHISTTWNGTNNFVIVTTADGRSCVYDPTVPIRKKSACTKQYTPLSTLRHDANAADVTKKKIYFTDFCAHSENSHMLLVIGNCKSSSSGSKRNNLPTSVVQIQSETMAYQSLNGRFLLQNEKLITSSVSPQRSIDQEVDDDISSIVLKESTKKRDISIMGPAESGSEKLFLNIDFEQQPRPVKRTKTDKDVCIENILDAEDDDTDFISISDRFQGMQQYYSTIIAPTNKVILNSSLLETSDMGVTSTSTSKKRIQQDLTNGHSPHTLVNKLATASSSASTAVLALQEGMNATNMDTRAKQLEHMLTQKILHSSGSDDRSNSSSAFEELDSILRSVHDLNLISNTVPLLQKMVGNEHDDASMSITTLLIGRLVYLIQKQTTEKGRIARIKADGQYIFWIKRILMEHMYYTEDDVDAKLVVDKLGLLLKCKVGNLASLLKLDGRVRLFR